jgi:hypothetical protein
MRKIYLSALLLGLACTVPANAKLDLASQVTLRQHRLEQMQNSKAVQEDETLAKIRKKVGVTTGDYMLATAILADGASADALIAEGANIYYQRKNIVFMIVPTDDVERISDLKSIRSMSLARKVAPKMDAARSVSGVDKIHVGEDLPQAYTGKGVVTGIVDAGLDPNHINFRNSDGTSRIGVLCYPTINSSTGNISTTYYGADVMGSSGPITAFTTDDNTTYHGTHTLGIMAGGYRGDATVAVKKNYAQSENKTIANPYYGIAYDSDIIATCGATTSDYVIAFGVATALDYAEYKGEPCVINLSLGSNSGPHDPNSTMGQTLGILGEDGIICICAGNEGDLPIAIEKKFTADDLSVKSCIYPYYAGSNYNYMRYGQVYAYSDDETPIKIQAVIVNRTRGTIVFRSQEISSAETASQYYVSSEDYQSGDTDIVSTDLARYFDGYVGVFTELDSATGRFTAGLDFYTQDTDKYNSTDNYVIGFIVTGTEGHRVNCYGDAAYTTLDDYGISGFTAGSTYGSLNDMACANNLLVVGAYNTKDAYPSLSGYVMTIEDEYPANEVSSFSSYGSTSDGRVLPHVVAPGTCIVASSSKYFIEDEDNGMTEDYICAIQSEDGRNNYWHASMGTSMSTPFVAGSIALWLEADPTLTIDEVQDIVSKTSVLDEYTAKVDPAQVGYGKFDAYAGLKEVLRRQAGVADIKADDSRLMITNKGDKTYELFLGGETAMKAVLYNLQGQAVASKSAQGDELTFNVSNVNPGIYILNVNGKYSQRIIVK